MPTPQQIIKDMETALHKELLKPLKFRKSASTWVRSAEWPQVINIQRSSGNSSDEASFTINLGLSIPALRKDEGPAPNEKNLKEYDCDLRCRIGRLLPYSGDYWWKITASETAENLILEVIDYLSSYGIPWLEQFADYTAIAREFEKHQIHFKAAIAYHLGGEKEAAEASMVRAQAVANEHFRPKLLRLAQKYSIPISS